ncbi:hypothetical protein Ancab_017570 [Ancistrocladus abbreviatus]
MKMASNKISSIAMLFSLVLTLSIVCLAQNSHHDYLLVHNTVRALVGVGPLVWNDTVAAYAQEYAESRAGECLLEHSQGPYGENIAEGWGGEFSGADAVKLWVDEKRNYDYGSNSCVGGECLHYTQVVWRNSVHLGCARVDCQNGGAFITCNYDPPGNYIGERPY